jgi:hypothetical protein
VSQTSFVLPLVRSRRRRGGSGSRRTGRDRSGRIRLLLLAVLAALAVGGAGVAVAWFASSDESLAPDDLTLSIFGIDVWPRTQETNPEAIAPLHVGSSPSGATVRLDGVNKGRTPLDFSVTPGSHSIALHQGGTIDVLRAIDVSAEGTALDVHMWRRQPMVLPGLPVFPGANLVDARFLDDGSVALVVGLPINASAITPIATRELWLSDASVGGVSRVLVGGDAELRPSVLAVSPDGAQVAFVGLSVGTGARAAASTKAGQAVWIAANADSAAPRPLYAAVNRDSRITDLSWDPQSQRLVIIEQLAIDPPRTQIVLVKANAQASSVAETLITLPATVVPGTESWNRDGSWFAFLSRSKTVSGASVMSLSAIEAHPEGSVRYIADLGSPQRSPTAPAVAWDPSDNGRVIFAAPFADAAPASTGPLDLFAGIRSAAPPTGLFATSIAAKTDTPHRLGSATGLTRPVWRSEEPALLAVARRDDASLLFRSVDPTTGEAKNVDVNVPSNVGRGSGLAIRWDEAHARALVLTRGNTGDTPTSSQSLKAWLIDFVANAAGRKD